MPKKAIQYGVSEYLLKPVTALELTGVIEKMKEKVDQLRKEKKKMESLTRTSENYRENVQVIRSKAMEALVNCTTDIQKSLNRLHKMGVVFPAADTVWRFLISISIPECTSWMWRSVRKVR